MTDQFPPEPGMRMPKGNDQPAKPPSLSIFTRRDAGAADTPADGAAAEPGASAPVSPPVAGIGAVDR